MYASATQTARYIRHILMIQFCCTFAHRARQGAMKAELCHTRFGPVNKCDMPVTYAFVVRADVLGACREGIRVLPGYGNLLGNSLMGVHVFRHADMCLGQHWGGAGAPNCSRLQLIVCKVGGGPGTGCIVSVLKGS